MSIELNTSEYEQWLERASERKAEQRFQRAKRKYERIVERQQKGINVFIPLDVLPLSEEERSTIEKALRDRTEKKKLTRAIRTLVDVKWRVDDSSKEEIVEEAIEKLETLRLRLVELKEPTEDDALIQAHAESRRAKQRTERWLMETKKRVSNAISKLGDEWNGSPISIKPNLKTHEDPFEPVKNATIMVGGNSSQGAKMWIYPNTDSLLVAENEQEDPALKHPKIREDYFHLEDALIGKYDTFTKKAAPVHDEWYLHKYQPSVRDTEIVNFPTGLFIPGLTGIIDNEEANPDKNVDLYENEIETILTHNDLHREEVDKAMSFLPNTKLLYGYLEEIGHPNVILKIRLLLEY